MIEVRDLTRRFGGVLAVDGISFEVCAREVVGFLGPNGAGKTTTIRMLAAFLPPTSGTVQVAGLDVQEDSLEVRRLIGYLPENNPLYEDSEVAESLEWMAELRGLKGAVRARRIRDAVERCGLGEALGRPIGQLSKGFRQRVGLAQAIVHDPPILFLDEPTSGLDPNQSRDVRGLILELKKEKTVLLSTHILPEVQAVCDRVLIIHRGSIAAQGTPGELRSAAQEKNRLSLTLKAGGIAPEEAREALSKVPGVTAVELVRADGELTLALEAEGTADPREAVFRAVVERRWTLLELRRETVSLEDIFQKLTL